MESTKRNNALVIFVIILCLLVLGLSGYIIYDKLLSPNNNQSKNIDNNPANSVINDNNLRKTALFAIKSEENVGKSLVAIDENGTETVIYNFSNYNRDIMDMQYYYDLETESMYLSIESYEKNNHREENQKWEIAKIDLSSNNYDLKILKEIKVDRNNFDKMFADNITKLGNYLYFSNSQLYKMNLDDYNVEKMDVTSNSRSIIVLSYSDNILIYNIDETIYKYNLVTETKEKIASNAIIEYIYKNELVYEDIKNHDDVYYSYNLDTNEAKQISEPINRGKLGFSYAIPYNKGYLYLSFTDSSETFTYDNNKRIKLSCDKFDIDVCKDFEIDSYIVYSDNILVTGAANVGPNDSVEDYRTFEIKINLNNQNITTIGKSNGLKSYRYITYIK